MTFKVNCKNKVLSVLFSITILICLHTFAENTLVNYASQRFIFSGNIIVNIVVSICLLSVLISFVHELIHGFVYKFLGGEVVHGFKGIYAYTEETSGIQLLKVQFLLVKISPLALISIISLVFPVWLGGMIFLINLMESSGDILMSVFLCKFKYNSRFVDKYYGFDVIDSIT